MALIKINAENLPAVTLTDSSKVEIGDVVLAIGNPFGIGQTVTKGIVSAKDRTTSGDGDEDFIQTDAAINPGNSGGALVDTEGRLIGINSAILTRSGGNQGIGFAVPSDLCRWVMDSLVTWRCRTWAAGGGHSGPESGFGESVQAGSDDRCPGRRCDAGQSS